METIDKILKQYNVQAKHQQELIQWYGGVSKCICVGCHGSTPHLTKTLIVTDKNGKLIREFEKSEK